MVVFDGVVQILGTPQLTTWQLTTSTECVSDTIALMKKMLRLLRLMERMWVGIITAVHQDSFASWGLLQRGRRHPITCHYYRRCLSRCLFSSLWHHSFLVRSGCMWCPLDQHTFISNSDLDNLHCWILMSAFGQLQFDICCLCVCRSQCFGRSGFKVVLVTLSHASRLSLGCLVLYVLESYSHSGLLLLMLIDRIEQASAFCLIRLSTSVALSRRVCSWCLFWFSTRVLCCSRWFVLFDI